MFNKNLSKKYTKIEELRGNFKNDNIHNKIWDLIFDTSKNKFIRDKNKHKFDFFIKINKIACSALFKVTNNREEI